MYTTTKLACSLATSKIQDVIVIYPTSDSDGKQQS